MNAAIVDTDVVSMIFKRDSRAALYRTHTDGRLLGVSFMTLAELELWPLRRRWGVTRKAELVQHLNRYTVLPVSRELCRKWAEVTEGVRRKGHLIQSADAWIAATALHYRVPLITHNGGDFAMIDGLQVLTQTS